MPRKGVPPVIAINLENVITLTILLLLIVAGLSWAKSMGLPVPALV